MSKTENIIAALILCIGLVLYASFCRTTVQEIEDVEIIGSDSSRLIGVESVMVQAVGQGDIVLNNQDYVEDISIAQLNERIEGLEHRLRARPIKLRTKTEYIKQTCYLLKDTCATIQQREQINDKYILEISRLSQELINKDHTIADLVAEIERKNEEVLLPLIKYRTRVIQDSTNNHYIGLGISGVNNVGIGSIQYQRQVNDWILGGQVGLTTKAKGHIGLSVLRKIK